MLRLDGYVNARCYAYEPPGQMLTEEAAIYFESFTISVVSGDDMICRLTRNSMQILKLEMTRLLSECQEPKYKVIGSALNSYCCGGKGNKKRPRIPTTLMMSPDRKSCILNVTDSDSTKERRRKAEKEKHRLSWVLKPFSPILQNEIQARVEKVKNLVKSMDPTHVKEEVLEEVSLLPSLPMYIPGKILYIEKCRLWNDDVDIDLPWTTSRFSMLSFDSDKSTPVKERSPMDSKAIEMNEKERKFKYAYTPRWASREEFQEIIVSRSILSDHFPFQMMKDLEAIEVGRKLRIPKYK